LRYESGRRNAREYILQIAAFLGEEYPKKLLANDEKILKGRVELDVWTRCVFRNFMLN
jgi:hypothetical protein